MKFPNLYDAAYLAITPIAGGMMAYKMYSKGKYRESGPAMLGRTLKHDDANRWANGSIWVHAVSVGEVTAAKAMLPLLRQQFPGLPILLTTHTETGQAAARDLPPEFTDSIAYYPLDYSWVVRRFVQHYKPRIFIPMETELWPNALDIISQSGANIFTLNGKMSERSYRRYQKIGSLIRRPLSRVTAFCVQTDSDRHRIATLLGSSSNVHVTGNCKFDVDIATPDENEKRALVAQLGMQWPARWTVAGSTHPGEEELIMAAMRKVWKSCPKVRLAIVPRHPERFAEVWQYLNNQGLAVARTSDAPQGDSTFAQVLLVDKMGVLTSLYSLAEVALVAGSFNPKVGGHNLLEAAAHAVPVVYGPHMKSQPDMARILSPENGGTIATPDTLADRLITLLTNPEQARKKGLDGKAAYLANRGSAERNMEILKMYLAKPS